MIKFKIITPNLDVLAKAAIESLKSQIEDRVKNVKCPEHNQRPKIIVSGSIQKPIFTINGCCQKLIDETEKVLR